MSNNKFAVKRKIFVDLAVGLVAVAFLISVKLYIDDSYISRWFNARGYELLHLFIPPFEREKDLSVVVVDISDLKRDPDGTTPAESLREIIEALVASKAKAIAIDIDFSPRADAQDPLSAGARHEDDEEFFEFLHEQKRNGVPVFVGAYNIGVEPKTWLGVEENKDLAADMTLFDEDTTQVPMWLRCGEDQKLNSISKALAEASGIKPAPNFLLKMLLVNPEAQENLKPTLKEDKNGKQIWCERAFTFVNYAKLELIQKLTLQATDRGSILSARTEEGKSKFEGKLVVIGNTQRGKASDCFVVLGRHRPITGSHIHASAAYSLVDEPVYKFKHGVTIALDFFLGCVVVLGLFCVRWRRREDTQFSFHLWESRFITFSILITLLLGFLLVRFFDVLWLDFSLVVFALLLHSKVQEWVRWVPTIFFIKKGPLPAKTE
ncbi:MAG: CHASE2 domain-containing protein [Pyrinomonadaceae bacterium]